MKKLAVGTSSDSAWQMLTGSSRILTIGRGKGAKMKESLVREEDGRRTR